MKHGRKTSNFIQKKPFGGSQAGFTIIEMMVVFTVFGILAAAAIVSWVSFTKYQTLRQEAGNLHKEILAMKAKALENGEAVNIKFSSDGTICTLIVPTDGGTPNRKTIKFADRVKVTAPTAAELAPSGDLPAVTGSSAWATGITVTPNNLTAFPQGWVVIGNGSNKFFCIMRFGDNSIKPELYQKSGTGGAWKKT